MKEQLLYKVIVKDKHGKVVAKQQGVAHSFIRQHTDLKFAMLRYPTANNVKDTGGVNRSIVGGYSTLNCNAPADETDYGIRVGTGNTAVTIEDYQLETPIAQGVGAGQMDYLVNVINLPVVGALDSKFEVKRTVYNGSGASIIVKEIGIYVQLDNNYEGCVARDVLGADVTVSDGGSITVFYYIRVAV